MTRWTYESADCITISHVSFLLRTLYYTIPHRAFIHDTRQKRTKEETKEKERENENLHLFIICHLVRRDCQYTPTSFEGW